MRRPLWLIWATGALTALILGLGSGIALSAPAAQATPTPAPACAFNDSIYNYDVSLTLVPPPAGQTDYVLRVAGVSADTCVPTFVNTELTAGGIIVHAAETSCQNTGCAAMLTPWTFDVHLGALPPGSYSAELVLQCGEKTFQCAAAAVSLGDVTVTPTPPPSATPVPTATLTPLPTATPPPTTTLIPTVTPMPTATPFVCDPLDPASVCNGVLAVRAFLDLRCDRFFNAGVDTPLGGTRVIATLPDGSQRSVVTNRWGETLLTGLNLPPGGRIHLTTDPPPAPWWVAEGGQSLTPCGSSTGIYLAAADFGLLGVTSLDLRWGLSQ